MARTSGATSTAAAPVRGRAARAEAKRKERIAKMRSRAGNRYLIHYDVDGPRVRLGILWFVVTVAAFAAGPVGRVLLYAVAFGAAGAHTLRTWRARGAAVDPRVPLVGVAVVVAAAGVAPQAMGVALLAMTVLVVVLAASELSEGEGAVAALSRASLVLQAAVPCAVAGGCIVLLADLEVWAAVSLVLIVSAYETGDYLIGSGASNALEGPLAGAAAVLVMTMAVAALGFPPFDVGEAVAFGLAVIPLAVGGQYLGSVLLPHARAYAPALRRVDSLLLAAPLWYLGIDLWVR